MDLGKLIYKKLSGDISEKDDKVLKEWIRSSEDNRILFSRLKALKNEGHDLSDITGLNASTAWEGVLQKLNAKKEKNFTLRKSLRYAALFIGLFGLGYGYWTFTQSNEDDRKESLLRPDAITLELGNGEFKVISNEESQNIAIAPGEVITTKKGENALDYSHISPHGELVYNTIFVPNGKRFKIVLSDSTIVHLNAGSSLKYPIYFLKERGRNVFLAGEAFFEVVKDRKNPFIVESGDINIRVLGTKFNVMAYEDDQKINTVLVEGSVSLYGASDKYNEHTSTILSPGYKATWDGSREKTRLEKVDTRIYTGWIDGKLVFRKLPFQEIVKKLQRHYNIRIHNTFKELDRQIFTATFDVETIEEVLNSFKEGTPFEYDMQAEQITIYKTKS